MIDLGKGWIVQPAPQDFNGTWERRDRCRADSPNTLRSRGGSANASGMMLVSVRRGALMLAPVSGEPALDQCGDGANVQRGTVNVRR